MNPTNYFYFTIPPGYFILTFICIFTSIFVISTIREYQMYLGSSSTDRDVEDQKIYRPLKFKN